MMRDGYEGWANGGAWTLMLACGVLLLLAVVVVVVVVLSRDRTPPLPGWPQHPPKDDALRLLEQRYAAGEIDGEEFHERRRTLIGG